MRPNYEELSAAYSTLAADLAKYQAVRVRDVDEKNWLRDRVNALEAALQSARHDIREAIPVTKHEYTLRRLQMGEATITAALGAQSETPEAPNYNIPPWHLSQRVPGCHCHGCLGLTAEREAK